MSDKDKPPRQWTWCFYCQTDRLTARKRKGYARAICNDCVEVRLKRRAA